MNFKNTFIQRSIWRKSIFGSLFMMTTLYDIDKDLNTLIERFLRKLESLLDWYSNNKLDLNWSKSFFMFKRRVLALGESLDSFGVVNRRQAREIIKKQLVC
jgi:hypothetical protein